MKTSLLCSIILHTFLSISSFDFQTSLFRTHRFCMFIVTQAVAKLSHVKWLEQKKLIEISAYGVWSCFCLLWGMWRPKPLNCESYLVVVTPSIKLVEAFHRSFICQDSESKVLHCSSWPRDLNSSCVCVCTFCESGKVMDPVGKQHQASGKSKEKNQKRFFEQHSGLGWFVLWSSWSVISTV